jgi:hypothetical protein
MYLFDYQEKRFTSKDTPDKPDLTGLPAPFHSGVLRKNLSGLPSRMELRYYHLENPSPPFTAL